MKLNDELLDRCASLVINRNSIQYIHNYIAYPLFLLLLLLGPRKYCSLQAYFTSPALKVPTCTARSERPLARKWGTMGEKCPVNFSIREFHAI
jgi:hypothetical protein